MDIQWYNRIRVYNPNTKNKMHFRMSFLNISNMLLICNVFLLFFCVFVFYYYDTFEDDKENYLAFDDNTAKISMRESLISKMFKIFIKNENDKSILAKENANLEVSNFK